MALFNKKSKQNKGAFQNKGQYASVQPIEQGRNVKKIVIDEAKVKKFNDIFTRYRSDKQNLTDRLRENEEWYRGRHWAVLHQKDKSKSKGKKKNHIEPKSAHLFNTCMNKHADVMDNYPAPNILPREEADKEQADILSSIIPVIFEQCNFEETFSKANDEKIKSGTGVYGVFWDKNKHNGIGDISITYVDVMNLFWESGVEDIQKSPYLFYVRLENNDVLESIYPQLKDKFSGYTEQITEYQFDDNVDTSNKSLVFDCYYKKIINNRMTVQLCTYCCGVVLYASENNEQTAQEGIYAHGLYPFEFDPLFKIKGSPAGFGYIDIGKADQEYIDRTDKAILENLLVNVKPRYVVSRSANINPEEFADWDKELIVAEGPVDSNSFVPIAKTGLSGTYVSVRDNKINELKETTGNRDISTGGTTSGVTAASAIAAMQEAGSKLSRDSTKATYRAYRNIVLMVIELIRQFYTLPRSFRVMGENGEYKYITNYTNAGLKTQTVEAVFGGTSTLRCPLFDVEISAQKQSPYSKLSQNEMALQFYKAGLFNPQLTDQALACLDMMDFDRKSFVEAKIQQNGTLYQKLLHTQMQLLQVATQLDQYTDTNLAQQVAAEINGGTVPPFVSGPVPNAENKESLGGSSRTSEAKNTKDARQRVAESTSPT